MTIPLTLGSLFDGIGGFPLAGVRQGFTPAWASEIEPFPIEVTKIRFPEMLHVGDITKLKGAELTPVDVVCGGSPCQDLSVAGKRAGLQGERSGLFMEQIRVIKELREHDARTKRTDDPVRLRPRYMVWENVPGAFSSADGEDFRAVLKETCRIADYTISVPRPPGGVWKPAGAILGDQFSLAWRVYDAQSGPSRKGAKESILSQILEDTPHPKYYLSKTACLGILRRAKKRGKELPPVLKQALEIQAGIQSV